MPKRLWNFDEVLWFSFNTMQWKMSSAKWQPFLSSLNMLAPESSGSTEKAITTHCSPVNCPQLWLSPACDCCVDFLKETKWIGLRDVVQYSLNQVILLLYPWGELMLLCCVCYIEAETKWPPFSKQHFQMYFLEWKCLNFDWNFTDVCSQDSDWQ